VIPVSKEPLISPSTYTKIDTFQSLPSNLPGRYHSIADYHELYLAGKLTPLAVAESLLPLIRRDVTPASSHSIAFVDTKVELILEAAKASTQRYKEGRSLGLLDGIPIGVKDECDVAGYRTFFGRKRDDKLFEVKTQSSWPVQKWQEAGVIIVGKLNMHEIGSG
jgi:Asp-tRNA(Asn)/Glu-tRNA(Gln) amidotransferase A subunit family amidase